MTIFSVLYLVFIIHGDKKKKQKTLKPIRKLTPELCRECSVAFSDRAGSYRAAGEPGPSLCSVHLFRDQHILNLFWVDEQQIRNF